MPRYLIGIGASAGGLEAISSLLAALPPKLPCSYVVIQHLSPKHRSILVELLAKQTALPVKVVTDGVVPQSDTIYVTPPNHDVTYVDGALHLCEPEPDHLAKPSINRFFLTLATALRENAIGVVLSGTGSDGTSGLIAIRAAGGIAFVQDPKSAKYDGMPYTAIQSGAVDRVLQPAQIATEIAELVQVTESEPLVPPTPADDLNRLLELVLVNTGIDFSGYKESTIWRRVQRRMVQQGYGGLSDYVEHCLQQRQELGQLAREFLISVTAFFRDPDAYNELTTTLREMLRTKRGGDEVRVWVPGCATGEEAYSIAMLLLELLAEQSRVLQLQLFATDIDDEALVHARQGRYSAASLSGMSPLRLQRFFIADQKGSYLVNRQLRDVVVFARQNVVSDPPFLRLDLVSCRNLMIYLSSKLQQRVLTTLHYGLRPGGLLFLGHSESIGQPQEPLFEPIHRTARLFQRLRGGRGAAAGNIALEAQNLGAAAHRIRSRTPAQLLADAVMRELIPACVLIDDQFTVLHSAGSVADLLTFPSSGLHIDLLQVVRPELRNELRTLLFRAARDGKRVEGRPQQLLSEQGGVIRCSVYPVADYSEGRPLYLVTLVLEPSLPAAIDGEVGAHTNDPKWRHLESELAAAREQLQTVVEELETSNEELQALNEEAQAANEELQAGNEELEASNEELQATNQELMTLNQEMIAKSTELATLNMELENLHNSLDFPLILVSVDLRVQRVNRAAIQQFDLPPTTRGHQLARLSLPAALTELSDEVQQVLREEQRRLHQWDDGERHLLIRLTPTFGITGDCNGVLIALIDHSELVRAQRQLRESQEQLLAMMNHAESMVALKDVSGRYRFINRRFAEYFEVDPGRVLGSTDQQLFGEDPLVAQLRSGDLEVLMDNRSHRRREPLHWRYRKQLFETVRFPLFDENGSLYAVCTQAIDVTEQAEKERELRLAAQVFEHAGEGIAITDRHARIITVNRAFSDITGYSPDEVVGQSHKLLDSGRQSRQFYKAMWQQLQRTGIWRGEIWNRRKGGEEYPELLTISAVPDESGEVSHYIGIFNDISAFRASQDRIAYLASHDDLTGLPNRNRFTDQLRHAIARAVDHQGQIGVMFIDLDNFKVINDTLGHEAGDRLLREVAQRLQRSVREQDLVARLGGDEFTILLEDIDVGELKQIAARINDQMAASFIINGCDLFVSASIGISLYPDDGGDSKTLLKHADTAMYRVKDQGRNGYRFFTEEMRLRAHQRLTIESGLRLALTRDELSLHYQPQIDLNDDKIVGAEVLLRWHSPVLGAISPTTFIPIAEHAGLMPQIDSWVLERTLQQMQTWQQEGVALPRISINLSPQQFLRLPIAEQVAERLQHYQIAGDRFGIELTEGSLMDHNETTLARLNALKQLGIHLSIDDFGTGYSSLLYLKRYPLDTLKIDKGFIDGLGSDESDEAITSAIIAMAQSLGLNVVAEGVENEAQRDFLLGKGCYQIQGFICFRPLSAAAFRQLLDHPAEGATQPQHA